MKKRLSLGVGLSLLACLALPGSALAQTGVETVKGELDITWVMVAAVLVLLMQAGFLFLEIGFSRQKNVGAGVAKILSISASSASPGGRSASGSLPFRGTRSSERKGFSSTTARKWREWWSAEPTPP